MSAKVHDTFEELMRVADIDQDDRVFARFLNGAFALWENVMSWQLETEGGEVRLITPEAKKILEEAGDIDELSPHLLSPLFSPDARDRAKEYLATRRIFSEED